MQREAGTLLCRVPRVTSWTKIVENGVALGGCKPFLCSSMDHEFINYCGHIVLLEMKCVRPTNAILHYICQLGVGCNLKVQSVVTSCKDLHQI